METSLDYIAIYECDMRDCDRWRSSNNARDQTMQHGIVNATALPFLNMALIYLREEHAATTLTWCFSEARGASNLNMDVAYSSDKLASF